jgi:hypothetical protein
VEAVKALRAWAWKTLEPLQRGKAAVAVLRVRDLTPAQLLAAAIVAPTFYRARWDAWTALPGDRFRDFRRMVTGEVVGGRPGHAVMLVTSDEVLYRRRVGLPPSPFDLFPRIERDVDLVTWWRQ